MSLISLMIVDDHTLIRQGLKAIVENTKKIKVIAEAHNGVEALELVHIYRPDIILLDIMMPDMNGLETLRKLKDLGVKSKVIILSSYSNKSYIVDAIKMGADGYLIKNCTSENLIRAITNVSVGSSYLHPSLAQVLRETVRENGKDTEIDKLERLSRREYEILHLIAQGNTNLEIGQELFISEKTVKNHITSIYKKIEVEDRVQAVIFAYNNELIEID